MKKKRLGIIGGGQLALMLSEAAKKLGVHVSIYCSSHDDPACQAADETHVGEIQNTELLLEFLNKIEVLTFENEFVDIAALEKAIDTCALKPHVYPSLMSIAVSQNKLRQKELFYRLHLDTSKHFVVQSSEDLNEASDRFGYPFVLKWSMFGYDGKGNCIINGPSDHEKGLSFIRTSEQKLVKTYAEAFVPFEHEAAMVYTRTRAGVLEHYPLLKTVQENGACKTVEGPMIRMGWSHSLESQAITCGRVIGDALQIVGTFAIEYFVVAKKLIINEMAPRVHNSGHFSLNALAVSQFENHIRAVCGLGTVAPGTSGFYGMVNILGVHDLNLRLPMTTAKAIDWMKGEALSLDKRLSPYWYGKNEIRPGRKLGHINVIADSLAELMDGMMLAKEAENRFWNTARTTRDIRETKNE